jgi:glucose/arabinose dehydrogenase
MFRRFLVSIFVVVLTAIGTVAPPPNSTIFPTVNIAEASVAKAIVPDYARGPHTASRGLTFNTGDLFPPEYKFGAFVGQHGSWNRIPRSGCKVIFVPFKAGQPDGRPVDILSGFISADDKARGRPVGVSIDRAGALLVADDVGNTIWRVTP